LGIGTSNPTAKTQTNATSAGAATVGLFLNNESDTIDTEVRLAFAANANNDIASNRYSYISAINTSGSNGQALRFATNQTGASAVEAMRIDSSGNLLVGTTSSDGKLVTKTSTTSQHALWVENTSGTVNFNTRLMNMKCAGAGAEVPYINFYGGATFLGRIRTNASSNGMDYTTASDYRLKENVVPMDGAIDRVKQLNPVRFNWIQNPDQVVDGFLAHEAQTVVPEAVGGEKDGMREEPVLDEDGNDTGEVQMVPHYQDIDQAKLVPLLTAALQEAVSKIEALETRIAALEA